MGRLSPCEAVLSLEHSFLIYRVYQRPSVVAFAPGGLLGAVGSAASSRLRSPWCTACSTASCAGAHGLTGSFSSLVAGPLRARHLGSSPPSASLERVGCEVCLARCVRDISALRKPRRRGNALAASCAWPAACATSRIFASHCVTGMSAARCAWPVLALSALRLLRCHGSA